VSSNARAFSTNLGRFKSVFISITLDKKLVCVFNLVGCNCLFSHFVFRSLSPSSVASGRPVLCRFLVVSFLLLST
ncbi:hypothetical protein L9F63_008471, partial [Diploptera punctata]